MTLSREEVAAGFPGELKSFSELVRSLDDKAWETPSRCEGWTVGDVARHVVGGMADVVSGNLAGLGSPEVTAREVQERRGRRPEEVADELDLVTAVALQIMDGIDDDAWEGAAPGEYDGTLGSGLEALYYDAYLHADDMRASLNQPSERGPGLRASVSHLAEQLEKAGWGPATLALDGVGEFQVGAGGKRIEGDALTFVLAATGRVDPANAGFDVVNIYAT
jgi:uncharacterized protein (TIGR03083 family)